MVTSLLTKHRGLKGNQNRLKILNQRDTTEARGQSQAHQNTREAAHVNHDFTGKRSDRSHSTN